MKTSTQPDPTFNTSNYVDAELGSFLERPVLIGSYNWSINTDISQVLYPWHAWASNTPIQDKINNFHLLRCNLHVKFVINGTPFHYGRVLASYEPLQEYNEFNSVAGGSIDLVQRSQRPHVFLDPTTSQGGCLCLPYVNIVNYFRVSVEPILRIWVCLI